MALLDEHETYQILGACLEVYKRMECGFLEAVCWECLFHEFTERGVPFRTKVDLSLNYNRRQLLERCEAAFICCEMIILEIKAVNELNDIYWTQVHNYLKATGLPLGMLVNFGHHPKLEHERFVR